MAGLEIAKSLFAEAKKYIPGGVNSPVRSFQAVGGYPVFVKRALGSKIYGECKGEFIDYCMSWGVLILGHTHPKVTKALSQAIENGTSFGTATKLEIELAKLIVEAIPSIEQIRLTNSGTEAVMGAIRLARAYTGKNKIIKFAGAYHGHADYLLVEAGSGQATLGLAASLGVPKEFIKHTLVLPFNDIGKVKETVRKYQKELAAIIVEPCMGNCGAILPQDNFLQFIREECDNYGIVMILDEVKTGFRIANGGAQEYYQIRSDLATYAKAMANGYPLAAFGGKKEIMSIIGQGVSQGGTFTNNKPGVAAAWATLTILNREPVIKTIEMRGKRLMDGIRDIFSEADIPVCMNGYPAMFSFAIGVEKVTDQRSWNESEKEYYLSLTEGMIERGVMPDHDAREPWFLCYSHSEEDIDVTLDVVRETIKAVNRKI